MNHCQTLVSSPEAVSSSTVASLLRGPHARSPFFVSGETADPTMIEPSTLARGSTWIKELAFSGRSDLTAVEIPDGVTHIGVRAFDSCRRLVSVRFPKTLISIEDKAFCYCTGLTSVSIPDSVT